MTQYYRRGLVLTLTAIIPAALTWAATVMTLLWLWSQQLTAHLDIIAPGIIFIYVLLIFVPAYGWIAAHIEPLLLED